MAKALVTGGAGFIGSNLARKLIDNGDEVVVFDNFLTGKKENLADILPKIRLIVGDLREPDQLKKALTGVEYIYHQAALPSVPRSIADPLSSNAHNVDGTLNLLIAARDAGVKRVVYAASSSAYGDVEAEFKNESMPPNPLSPYALTKWVGEAYCKLFTNLYGLETVALRYFNVFGPYQDPNSQYAAVIPKFIIAMLKSESPIIYGDGETSRDFTFVANNVEANILAGKSDKATGEMMNIACGGSITLNHLVKMINDQLGTDIKPRYQPAKPGDIKHSKADIGKAKRLLNYQPVMTFEEGLRETIAWYRNKLS